MGTALDIILTTDCRGQIESWGGGTLLINGRTFGAGIDVADINAGCPAEEVIATQDGRGAILTEWHRGELSGEEVYFERFSSRGRESHGWIDCETRKLVQAG
jgi:hypothetical protein